MYLLDDEIKEKDPWDRSDVVEPNILKKYSTKTTPAVQEANTSRHDGRVVSARP